MYAFASPATTASPAGAYPAEGAATGRGGAPVNSYAATGTATTLAPAQVAPMVGGNQAHNNMQPYLVLNWCIALTGIFPARS
jgi:microcystin-dependent protein